MCAFPWVISFIITISNWNYIFSLYLDFKIITERLKSRYYCHVHLFKADVMRIFSNCKEVYSNESDQVKAANQLQGFFEKKLQESGFN